MTDSSNPRPYWLVDLKWITGILLAVLLHIILLVNCLVIITSEKVALDVLSKGLASAFNLEKGFNDITEINQLKQALKANPNASIKPISGLPVTLKARDIATISNEIRINIFRQVAQYIYYGEMEKETKSGEKNVKISVVTAVFEFLSLVSKENHDKLFKILLVLVGTALILLIALICFSHRFGRIASPGFVLMTACLPGMVLLTLLNMVLRNGSAFPPPQTKESMIGVIGYIASVTLPPILDDMIKFYFGVIITGIMIVFIALLSKIGWAIFANKGEHQSI